MFSVHRGNLNVLDPHLNIKFISSSERNSRADSTLYCKSSLEARISKEGAMHSTHIRVMRGATPHKETKFSQITHDKKRMDNVQPEN